MRPDSVSHAVHLGAYAETIALCIRLPPMPSNWTSKGQCADPGHGRSTGTLPGQPVGSELFLQFLDGIPPPTPLQPLSSSAPHRV